MQFFKNITILLLENQRHESSETVSLLFLNTGGMLNILPHASAESILQGNIQSWTSGCPREAIFF